MSRGKLFPYIFAEFSTRSGNVKQICNLFFSNNLKNCSTCSGNVKQICNLKGNAKGKGKVGKNLCNPDHQIPESCHIYRHYPMNPAIFWEYL